MKALSPAQLKVLRRMAAGEILLHIGGPEPTYFFHTGERSIDYRTVFILQGRMWIEAFKRSKHSLDPAFRITMAGHEGLLAIEGTR